MPKYRWPAPTNPRVRKGGPSLQELTPPDVAKKLEKLAEEYDEDVGGTMARDWKGKHVGSGNEKKG